MAAVEDPDLAAGAGAPTRHAHPPAAVPWPGARDDRESLARCSECGLATLRLFLRSAEWVVRRVERIEFLDERTVRRRMSVDYRTPRQAVTFLDAAGNAARVLPITIMRRKSLVNFDLRDEDGRCLPLMGLRETQALTEAVLRAWAERTLRDVAGGMPVTGSAPDPLELSPAVAAHLEAVAAGDQTQMTGAVRALRRAGAAGGRNGSRADDGDGRGDWPPATSDGQLAALGGDPVFMAVLERLAGNFLLFTLDDGPADGRRIVKFSSDEPLTLRYATATYRGHPDGPCAPGLGERIPPLSYGSGQRKLSWLSREPALAALGFRPALVRFPVPAAELATSFHLEVTAPPEVSIVRASLLAGLPSLYRSSSGDPREDKAAWAALERRPGDGLNRRPSFDSVGGGYPTVDLHVVDVPVGSLSRAQVYLQASDKGWMATAAAATWLAAVALFVSAYLLEADDQDTSTVLSTLVAGVAGMLVRPDPHRMVTRLLTGVRMLVAASAVLALLAAFAFAVDGKATPAVVTAVAWLSLVPALAVSRSWWCCHRSVARARLPSRLNLPGRRRDSEQVRLSPWEQQLPGERPDEQAGREFYEDLVAALDEADHPFDLATVKLGYDAPAIKVASAEAARSRFDWTLRSDRAIARRLG